MHAEILKACDSRGWTGAWWEWHNCSAGILMCSDLHDEQVVRFIEQGKKSQRERKWKKEPDRESRRREAFPTAVPVTNLLLGMFSPNQMHRAYLWIYADWKQSVQIESNTLQHVSNREKNNSRSVTRTFHSHANSYAFRLGETIELPIEWIGKQSQAFCVLENASAHKHTRYLTRWHEWWRPQLLSTSRLLSICAEENIDGKCTEWEQNRFHTPGSVWEAQIKSTKIIRLRLFPWKLAAGHVDFLLYSSLSLHKNASDKLD